MFKRKKKTNIEDFDIEMTTGVEDALDNETLGFKEDVRAESKKSKDKRPKKSLKKNREKKPISNRTIIGTICIIASAILVFGGSIFNEFVFNNQKKIFRAIQPIPRGTVITNDMFNIVTVGALGLNEHTLIVGEVSPVGMLSDMDIKAGDNFTNQNVTPQLTTIHPELETLEDGKVAMTIRLENSAATLGYRLRAGDVVSILNTSAYSAEERYKERQKNLYNNLQPNQEKQTEPAQTPEPDQTNPDRTETNNAYKKDNEISDNETMYIARDLFLQYVEILYIDQLLTESLDKGNVEDNSVNITLKVYPEQLEALSIIQSSANGHIAFVTRDVEQKKILLAKQKEFIDAYLKERQGK